MMPAPFLTVFEYAKCICAAMWAPDEKPETETSFTLTLYLGRATTAPKALALSKLVNRTAASCLVAAMRCVMLSPIVVVDESR
jgi:hypothetical protein